MSSQADITVDRDRLCVSGMIDFFTAMQLWQQSLPLLSQKNTLDFDFSAVISANSAALALLLEWLKYAKREQKTITFHGLPSQLLSIATIAGLENILTNSK